MTAQHGADPTGRRRIRRLSHPDMHGLGLNASAPNPACGDPGELVRLVRDTAGVIANAMQTPPVPPA